MLQVIPTASYGDPIVGNKMLQGIPTASYGDPPASAFSHYEDQVNININKRRNNVKARTTLLLALPDEHQLRFNKYETAKELWEAILKTFGRNEATKKTKKNQLKMQYGNFKAEGSETLEQSFNRLQAIVSHLESSKEVRIKLSKLGFHFVIKHSSGKGEVHTASVPTASIQVSTASIDFAAASLSHGTVYAADRFWKKIGKKITIQGSDVAGFDKSKVEFFNCHKMGHFARECRAPRSQDRGKRESYKQGPKEEEPAPKALMAIDGIRWDWSYMANEEENHALVADDKVPTEFALMSKSSSSSDKEVRVQERAGEEVVLLAGKMVKGHCLGRWSLGLWQARIVPELWNLDKLSFIVRLFDKNLLPDLAFLCGFCSCVDIVWSTPSIDASKCNKSELQSSNFFVYEHGESTGSIMLKPMIKFVKEADCTRVIKINNIENARKSTVKYAEMYRNISKVNTARPKAVINVVRTNRVNDVKASAFWVSKPIKPNSASINLKRYDYVDVRGRSKSVMAWVPKKLSCTRLLGLEKESLGQEFEDLPLYQDIISFNTDLGHAGDFTYLNDVNVDYLHQPWRAFATIINKCLSGKETGMDNVRMYRAQIL
nr:ribonuclease H-like domain-containing protein [Tanacetum cinerariifolium]